MASEDKGPNGGRPVITVTTNEQSDEVIDANSVIVHGIFADQNSDKAKAFLAAATQIDIQFVIFVPDDSKIVETWNRNIFLKKHSQYIWYKGDSEIDDIVSWVKRKTDPPIEVLSVEQAKETIAANDAVVFGFFADRSTDRVETFLKIAGLFHEEVFAIVSDDKVIAELKAKDQDIVVFKKFDENRVKYESGIFTEEVFKSWVVQETIPILYVDSRDPLVKLYEVEFPYELHLFLSKENGDFEKYIDKLKPVAKKYRNKIPLSSVVDVDEKKCNWSMEQLDVKKEEVPCVRMTGNEKDDVHKRYKSPSKELTPESVEEFIQAVLAGNIEPYRKQQELPKDWNKKPLKELVASNFDEVVNDTTKKVCVDFYATWCGPCVHIEPIIEKLAEHFEKNQDVVIAKMDAFNNELEHLKVRVLPTIRLYCKDNQVREYKGDRSLESFIKFVESDGLEESTTKPAANEAPA